MIKEPFSIPLENKYKPFLHSIIEEIKNQPDEYFSSVITEEYQSYLLSKYELPELPIIHWEETQIDFGETEIYGRDLPNSFRVYDTNKKFSFTKVIYHIPFSGKKWFLQYRASNVFSTAGISGELSVSQDVLTFTKVDMQRNPEQVQKDFDYSKKSIIGRLDMLEKEKTQFNSELPTFIIGEINKRKQSINQTNDYRSKFSFPIKKKDNVPDVFQIPSVIKKKKIVPKPTYSGNGSIIQERFIDDDDYESILKFLQDCGKNWEHYPNTYEGKGEEALRDQLIFVLAPNIEGVVAGEAYNKGGKTDIAIKYESTNLFIGECKIWTGSKGFSDTIDQILRYLSWRDSKAAIMMFVPNKEMSEVIETADKTAKEHSNFVRELKKVNIGWTNYRFHLEDDPGSYLTIAVQLYHMPKLKRKTKVQR